MDLLLKDPCCAVLLAGFAALAVGGLVKVGIWLRWRLISRRPEQ
ncbi:MAG: hypothetical protein ACT4P5_14105 [Armatimonadota bacterium]